MMNNAGKSFDILTIVECPNHFDDLKLFPVSS